MLTFSEGFRPGILNRPGGSVSPDGNFTVPYAIDTDDMTNYELGWKLDLLDYTLRFNGALFFSEIDRLQTTIFDPSITNLFFSDNAADAEVNGVEGDFIWAPAAMPGLNVIGAFRFLIPRSLASLRRRMMFVKAIHWHTRRKCNLTCVPVMNGRWTMV